MVGFFDLLGFGGLLVSVCMFVAWLIVLLFSFCDFYSLYLIYSCLLVVDLC